MATKVILSGGDETARLAATNTSESGIIKHNSTSGLIYVGDGTTAWKDMTKANTVAVDASRVTGVTELTALTSATVANDDVLTIWDTSASAPKKIAKSDLVAGGSGGDIDTTSATLDHVIINITSINNPTTPWVPTYAGTDVYDVTALARDLTINTPTGYGVDGYASLVIRISAITLDRTITPSGYTIIGGGTTFTVAAGTTRVFSVKRYDSTWTWNGNLLATDIPDLSATYQPKDATLTALASVTTAADKLIYATASDTFSTTDITSTARSILDDTSTSAVLTTIGAQPLDATLTALAGVTTAADKMIYATASDTFSTTTVTAAARGLLDDADTATMLTTLGAAASGHNHSGTYQPADATLTALAGVTTAADKLIYATAADTFSTTDITATARSLLDDTSTSAMLTTLGAAATGHTHSGYQATIDNTVDVTAKSLTVDHSIATITSSTSQTSPWTPTYAGSDVYVITALANALTINTPTGYGTSGYASLIYRITASAADRTITPSGYTILGGGTSFTITSGTTRVFSIERFGATWVWNGDLVAADIPTIAQSQVTDLTTDLAAKAPLAGPTFTGVPAAPTAAADTNTTQIATTAYVVGQAGTATPAALGTAAAGTSLKYARSDHVHAAVADATTTTKGLVELATDGENASSVVVQGNDKRLSESIIIACSDETTAITAGTGKVAFRMPYAFTLTDVRASLSTAQPSGGTLFTVDVNEGGTSILSTELTFDNTEKTTTTATTARVISDTALADDAEITVDVDAIGDSGAKGLKVTLIGYRA